MSSCLFSPLAVPSGKVKRSRRATALVGDAKSNLLASQLTEFFMSSNRDSNKPNRKLSRKSSKVEGLLQASDNRLVRLTVGDPLQELKSIKQLHKKLKDKEHELHKLQSAVASVEGEALATKQRLASFEELFEKLHTQLQRSHDVGAVQNLAVLIHETLHRRSRLKLKSSAKSSPKAELRKAKTSCKSSKKSEASALDTQLRGLAWRTTELIRYLKTHKS